MIMSNVGIKEYAGWLKEQLQQDVPGTSLMARKRTEEDRVYQLEQQVRDLKQLNRQLMRRLRKVDKGYKFDDAEDENDTRFADNVCKQCCKGVIVVSFDVPGRKLVRCTICDYRLSQKV